MADPGISITGQPVLRFSPFVVWGGGRHAGGHSGKGWSVGVQVQSCVRSSGRWAPLGYFGPALSVVWRWVAIFNIRGAVHLLKLKGSHPGIIFIISWITNNSFKNATWPWQWAYLSWQWYLTNLLKRIFLRVYLLTKTCIHKYDFFLMTFCLVWVLVKLQTDRNKAIPVQT